MRLAVLISSCAMPAMAQDFSLDPPIDCLLGETCYIQNYVDADPTDAARDFACGSLTYNAHKGTDFGLLSLAAIDAGVDVLAAADGVVRGTRNNMPDVLFTNDFANEIDGRDCGNGVVIEHGDGWETQYCHLKQGSVSVLTGDVLEAGDVLGQVGLSGRTQFPHLHISVRRHGETIDPFDPNATATCNAPVTETLWSDLIDTPQGGILAVGFADSVPAYDDVKAGTAALSLLSADAPMVVWGYVFGPQNGDVLSMKIDGPMGTVFENQASFDRSQALAMRAGGRRAPEAGWPSGSYTGLIEHIRDGEILDSQTTLATLPEND